MLGGLALEVDDNLFESAAGCLDAGSLEALENLKLGNEAQSREYNRFIELGDILATLRLKARRQITAR